jgi:glutamyl-tRNA reductase
MSKTRSENNAHRKRKMSLEWELVERALQQATKWLKTETSESAGSRIRAVRDGIAQSDGEKFLEDDFHSGEEDSHSPFDILGDSVEPPILNAKHPFAAIKDDLILHALE